MGPKEILSFTDDAGKTRFFRPDSDALTSFLNTETTTPLDLSKLTGQEFKDTIVGSGNISDVGFDKKLKALQGTKGIGSQQGLQALNKAKSFMQGPIGFNMPTATKVGLGSMPYFAAEAANYKKQMEQEEEEAAAQQQSYADAMSQLGTYYSRLADPTRRFGEYEFAANGGRVNKNVGGLLRLLAKPAAKAFDKVKTRLSRMTDDVEIYGSSDYADDTGAAFSAFAMPKTKKGLRELNKLADEGLITKEADGAFDLGQETRMEALEELFPYMGKNLKASGAIDDINEFRNIKQLQEGSSGYGPDYGFDEILEYITRGRKAEGGLMETRAGYNMGGMGSIPQTPMVPQGMQLDGRGGGFIPMGAQEKHDDVPAMLAKNEFVMTSDAVKAAGGGSIEKGAQKMYDLMNQLEAQV